MEGLEDMGVPFEGERVRGREEEEEEVERRGMGRRRGYR